MAEKSQLLFQRWNRRSELGFLVDQPRLERRSTDLCQLRHIVDISLLPMWSRRRGTGTSQSMPRTAPSRLPVCALEGATACYISVIEQKECSGLCFLSLCRWSVTTWFNVTTTAYLSATSTRSCTAQHDIPCAKAIAIAAMTQTFLNCVSPSVLPIILRKFIEPTAYTNRCPTPTILLTAVLLDFMKSTLEEYTYSRQRRAAVYGSEEYQPRARGR